MAELHWAPLKRILAKYICISGQLDYETVLDKLNSDMHYLRQIVSQNLHIVTTYFEAHIIIITLLSRNYST